MCELIMTGCNRSADAIMNGVFAASQEVARYCGAVDRTLTRITNENLPDTTARVIQQMYRTVPITACFLFAPVPTLVGLAVIHIVEFGPIFRPETYIKIAQGAANIPLLVALDNTVRFMITRNPLYKEVIYTQLIYAALFRTALYGLVE